MKTHTKVQIELENHITDIEKIIELLKSDYDLKTDINTLNLKPIEDFTTFLKDCQILIDQADEEPLDISSFAAEIQEIEKIIKEQNTKNEKDIDEVKALLHNAKAEINSKFVKIEQEIKEIQNHNDSIEEDIEACHFKLQNLEECDNVSALNPNEQKGHELTSLLLPERIDAIDKFICNLEKCRKLETHNPSKGNMRFKKIVRK